MLVVLLVDADASRRGARLAALQDAGHAVAVAGVAADIPPELSPDVVVIPGDADVLARDAALGRTGPVPLLRDDGDVDALIAALRQVAVDSRPLLRIGPATVDLRTRTVVIDGRSQGLSPKEAALLAWMASRGGALLSRSELLVHVWGYHPDSTSRTLDVTIGRLREKLEVDPRDPQHLLTVRGEGYRLVGATVAPAHPAGPLRAPRGLFGREEALADLVERSRPGGVLTLLGPPGIGKTTLARALLEVSGRGVFVALADATSREHVQVAISTALGRGHQATPIEELGDALAARGAELVVLDNAEQVAAPVAEVLAALLDLAPEVRWVVTSRTRLRLGAEHVAEVSALTVDASVALFLARARQLRPGYGDEPDAHAHLEGLATDLEGLPLALELAAARCRLFGPATLRERIQRSLQVLRDDRRDRPARQQTLEAAVDWSWALLDPAERQALAQLSVACGSVEVAAAEATLALPDRDPIQVLEALVDHSLIRLQDDGRLAMHVVIRDFARRRLDEIGDAAAARDRHRAWFVDAARRWVQDREGPRSWEIVGAVRRDRENLLAALGAARTADDVAQLIGALHVVWEIDSLTAAEVDAADRALAACPGPEQVEGAWALSRVLNDTGRWPEAAAWRERVEALADTPARRMRVHDMSAVLAERAGDLAGAIALYRAALAEPADEPTVRGRAYVNLAVALRSAGDREGSRQVLAEGLRWARLRGVPAAERDLDGYRATILALDGAHAESIALCERMLAYHRERGSVDPVAHYAALIGLNLARCGRAAEALGPLDEAVELTTASGRRFLLARIHLQRARARWAVRDLDGALEDAQLARRLGWQCGDTNVATFGQIAEVDALRELGRLTEAAATARDAQEAAARLEVPAARAQAAHAAMLVALRLGAVEEARAACEEALANAAAAVLPVLHGWRAVIAHLLGASAAPHLDAAAAAARPDDGDPAGFVALVGAVVRGDDDLSAPGRLLRGWQPALASALPAVVCAREGRALPADTFAEGRILAALAQARER